MREMKSVKSACQATVLQFGPDPAVGERLNIGVLLVCADRGFCGVRLMDTWGRVTSAFNLSTDGRLRRIRAALEEACRVRGQDCADLDTWMSQLLLPADSALVRSPTISGVTRDPLKTLDDLYETYVGKYEYPARRPVVEDVVAPAYYSYELAMNQPESEPFQGADLDMAANG